MIWTSTSGITINSSERPNIVCGSNRLIQPRGRMSKSSAASDGGDNKAPDGAGAAASIRLERIAGAAHGLQIARETRVAFDLAAQSRHLHVDGADIAAELAGLRQFFPRYRLARVLREAAQE